jgi:hypothetical protein
MHPLLSVVIEASKPAPVRTLAAQVVKAAWAQRHFARAPSSATLAAVGTALVDAQAALVGAPPLGRPLRTHASETLHEVGVQLLRAAETVAPQAHGNDDAIVDVLAVLAIAAHDLASRFERAR